LGKKDREDMTNGKLTRAHLIVDFLASNGWAGAVRYPLSGDASFRRYERLVDGKRRAVLMDAPPPHEDVRPFLHIDGYLRRRGFNAPEVYAEDVDNGFLLLEDLGDDVFTRVLSGDSKLSASCDEVQLYSAAIDVLVELHRSSLPKKLPQYNDSLLMEECELLTDWYLPAIGVDSKQAKSDYLAIWEELIRLKKIAEDVVVLRDYHADNLMWLPERDGLQCVGLLDFQDAAVGSPVYDIVSLLEDARRDVDLLTASAMIDRYLQARQSIRRDEFMAVYSILAAQRNSKIVGIFARLAVRDKKERYLTYLPRVWKYIMYDLQHPVLAELRQWFDRVIPNEKRKPGAFKIINKGKK